MRSTSLMPLFLSLFLGACGSAGSFENQPLIRFPGHSWREAFDLKQIIYDGRNKPNSLILIEIQDRKTKKLGVSNGGNVLIPPQFEEINFSREPYHKTIFIKRKDNRWFAFDPFSLKFSDAVYDEASIQRYRELETLCGPCLENWNYNIVDAIRTYNAAWHASRNVNKPLLAQSMGPQAVVNFEINNTAHRESAEKQAHNAQDAVKGDSCNLCAIPSSKIRFETGYYQYRGEDSRPEGFKYYWPTFKINEHF